jgi:hypothetical protein
MGKIDGVELRAKGIFTKKAFVSYNIILVSRFFMTILVSQ